MSNVGQALTHQMIAREAAKMLVEENTVFTNINTDRKEEFAESVNGYKKGDTVKVMVPPVPATYTGASFAGGGSAPAMTESYVNLTLDQQVHVPITFTAKEKLLEISEFNKRFLRPSLTALSSKVNSIMLTEMKNCIPNVVGTWGTTPATRAVWRNAASKMDRFLAPEDQRYAHMSPDANDALAEANATLFHSSEELRGEFSKNAIGMFAGLEFFKQLSLPLHTNGAGASYVCNGTGGAGIGTGLLVVKTGTGAIPRGSVLTIAGVNAVHPITGVSNGTARQFVVTADYAGGAGTVSIAPAIIASAAGVIGTVDAIPGADAVITIFGTASQSKAQDLVFHRDSFASAFAPLPMLASCEGYTATVKGISVRVMSFGSGLLDTENTRIDVLFALPAPIRRDHACRVTE